MTPTNKIIAAIAAATLVILVGGIFLFGRSSQTPPTDPKVDSSVLIRSDSQTLGTDSATVTLVEFGDFQCPACGSYHPLVKKLIDEFDHDLTFVFRNFPLPVHKNAYLAAQAAEAAGRQNKYWAMHDYLYEHQSDWSDKDNVMTIFSDYAKTLGLSVDQFKKDYDSTDIKTKIARDLQDGNTLGVDSTPTFYLDSEKITNPGSLDDFRTLIKAAILKSPLNQKDVPLAVHLHADFKVYIGGKAFDFTKPQYQSTKDGKDLSEDVHLHDGNGTIIHVHKAGITLGDFFTSLPFPLATNLKLYVNGKLIDQPTASYVPVDLDRILITDSVTQAQLDSVSDTACIYSEKCPQRGKPPTENCVGGLGTGCKDQDD